MNVLKGMGCLLAALAAVGAVEAEPTKELVTEGETTRYVISVPAGEDYTLTADDVAAMEGHPLHKTGDGTLRAGDAMALFAGDIHVEAGVYRAETSNALGTSDGQTYVTGGTLLNRVGSSHGGTASFPNEHIHLAGTGYDNQGALRTEVSAANFCRTVTFEDDVRITGTERLDFRYTALDMKGHTLTTSFTPGGFYFVALTIANMGDIAVEQGSLEFQASVTGTSADRTVTLAPKSGLTFWNSTSWLTHTFVFGAGTYISAYSDPFNLEGTNDRAILAGTVRLDGPVSLSSSRNHQVQLRGYVTGPGGFTGGKGGWLQLNGPTNDFKGGLSLAGVAGNACTTGGVVVYANGAIPKDGGALALTNAAFWTWAPTAVDLPDFTADGHVTVTGRTAQAAVTTKSLVKTGNGPLDVALPLKVLGTTDIQGGTLRFTARVPEIVPGLNYYFNMGTRGGVTSSTVPSRAAFQEIDSTGVAYAYKGWPWGVDMEHYYTGYIRVPGEEGKPVTCNFMTSIARHCTVIIGGVTCAQFNDNANQKDNVVVGWDRLSLSKPVTLTAGWQPIYVYMGNYYNDTRGPQDNTALGWVADFGIGVDWQARCVTNAAHYAKLLDPGDGSFLRATLEAKDQMDPATWRPTFAGPAAFATGTVLDVNDTLPYTPLVLPSLTGVPVLTNGAVTVASSTWTLREADVRGGVPLTITAGSSLAFPAGAVTVAPADAAWMEAETGSVSYPILTATDAAAFPAHAFTLAPEAKAAKWRLVRDGNTLLLDHTLGLTLILR